MYTQKENKNKSFIDNSVLGKNTSSQCHTFSDNRSAAILQKKQINIINNSIAIQRKKTVTPRIPVLNPLISGGRRYWTRLPQSAFSVGNDWMNAVDSKYKKQVGANEVHATLRIPLSTVDKSNELRAYIRANDASTNGQSIKLSPNWSPTRQYVGDWHISLKNGLGNHLGGWYNMNGIPFIAPAAGALAGAAPVVGLPAYTNRGAAATPAEVAAANTICTNMVGHIL